MQKSKTIFCRDQLEIESKAHEWAQERGCEIKKQIIFDNKWRAFAGKTGKIKIKANTDGSLNIKNMEYQDDKAFFALENYEFKEGETYTKPQPKSCLTEFNSLPPAKQNHPYLLIKKISVQNLNIKQEKDILIIPVYSPKGEVISWQKIYKEGRDKFFKRGYPLGQGYHFPIGQASNKVYVCEGFATGVSIHTITGHKVYCSFGKNNLDTVTEYVLKKYPKAKIIQCLDNDAENTHKTKIKDKRLTIICPEKKGDFNDFQADAFEITKLISLNRDTALLLKDTIVSDIIRENPVDFYQKILLNNEFNFGYGEAKIGKSRAFLLMILEGLKLLLITLKNQNKNINIKCAILSTENDPNTMIKPLIEGLDAEEYFTVLNDKICKYFPIKSTPQEKIQIFLDRLNLYFYSHKHIKALFLDPLPRFIEWNNEVLATQFIDGLRDLAKKYNVLILGIRNEGKTKEYKTSQLYKGSSALSDITRQSIRAVGCHYKSSLGKKFYNEKDNEGKKKKTKSLIIYTELSSLFSNKALLYTLEIKNNIAIPVFQRTVEYPNAQTLNYLCSEKSGKSLSNKIFDYINSQTEKGCTLQDLYDHLAFQYDEKEIRDAVYRSFDSVKIGPITYVSLQKTQEKAQKTQ